MSIESPLKDLNILVTGGTGSFGKEFLHTVLTQHSPRRVVIFSRDELKQYEMRQIWGDDDRRVIHARVVRRILVSTIVTIVGDRRRIHDQVKSCRQGAVHGDGELHVSGSSRCECANTKCVDAATRRRLGPTGRTGRRVKRRVRWQRFSDDDARGVLRTNIRVIERVGHDAARVGL